MLLQQAGHSVTLVGRAPHVNAIRSQGGVLMNDCRPGKSGSFLIPIDASERLHFTPEVLVIATKLQDVAGACRASLPYANEVPAVMLQNGVSGDSIAGDILGRRNIIGCIVRLGIIYLKHGTIERRNDGWLVIGESFQRNNDRTDRVAEALGEGIETILTDNIMGARWTKLLLSVQGLLQAITGLAYPECKKHDNLSLLALALVQETARVADRAGVTMAPIDGISLSSVAAIRDLPPILHMRLQDVPRAAMPIVVFRAAFSPMGSTLQSRKRRTSTEVDYLNGEVVRAAAEMGMAAPLNERIVGLMHELEKTERYLTPEELWAEFASVAASH